MLPSGLIPSRDPQPNQPAQAAFCTTEPHPTASASAGSDGQSGKASSSVNLLETVSPSRPLLDHCWPPTPPAETYQPVSRFGHARQVSRKTAAESQSYPAHKSHLLLNDRGPRAKNRLANEPSQIT